MARPIWTGALSFGLVNVPVRMYPATQEKQVRFRQLEAGTGERIRYKRVAEGSGEEVPYESILKGYELPDGRWVALEREELDALAPEQNRAIEIERFVALDEIDPIVWDRTYYLGGDERAGADKAYALLHCAMQQSERVGIGRFVLRQRQYLASVRPLENGLLALETMWFADEIRDPSAVEHVPEDVSLRKNELSMARELIERMSEPFEHEAFPDTHRERVLELIDRKAAGETIEVGEPEPESAQVIDLVQALKASLGRERGGARRRGGAKPAGLEKLSKQQLYERAAEAEIDGRSKMTKSELIDALRKAS